MFSTSITYQLGGGLYRQGKDNIQRRLDDFTWA